MVQTYSQTQQTKKVTLNSSFGQLKNKLQYRIPTKIHTFINLCIFLILIVPKSLCTQIQIITKPTSNQLKSLNLLKSLRRYRQRYINLNNQTYVCVTSIKQKPTSTQSSSSQKTKLTTLYLNGNVPTSTQTKVQPDVYAKQLDLLQDGIGVRHYTKQFIYGYKHKRIMSQFDDDFTKYNNQKKQHQNYTMGIYDIAQMNSAEAAGTSAYNPNIVQITYQIDYIRNQNTAKTGNLLKNSQQPLAKRYAHQAFKYAHIDHNGQRIILTSPLNTQKHTVSKSYNITFQCESTGINQKGISQHNVTQTGVSITNYQIQLINRIPTQCKKVISIVQMNKWMVSFQPSLNVLNDKIVGDVDKFCGIDIEQRVHVGDYLLLQTQRVIQLKQPRMKKQKKPKVVKVAGATVKTPHQIKIQQDPVSGFPTIVVQTEVGKQEQQYQLKSTTVHSTTQYFIVQITKIAGQNVYQINKLLPWALKVKKCKKLQLNPQYTINYGGQVYINNDDIQQGYQINNKQKDKIMEIQRIGNKFIQKINNKQLKAGDNLFCVAQMYFSIAPSDAQIFYFSLTLGEKFGQNYIEIYPWINFNQLSILQLIVQVGNKMNCLPLLPKQKPTTKQLLDSNNQTSSVIKMSKKMNNKIKFKNNEEIQNINSHQKLNEDSILMITMSKDAVVQISTTIYQSEQQEIDVSPSGLFDEQTQSNQNSKQTNNDQKQINEKLAKKDREIGTNKYFLTSQKIYKIQTTIRNKTKVRVQRLQNSLYENNTNDNYIILYKGIWRAGDFVKFPRFLFHQNERFTGIHVKYGTAYVRVVDLSKINRQYFVVSSTLFNHHAGYGPKNRPGKSISTEKKFKWGTFCGGNINKNREALIKMKCGQSWFKLHSVTQTEPCTYEIQIITQFLCDKNVVFPALKQGISTFSGSLCLPVDLYKQE